MDWDQIDRPQSTIGKRMFRVMLAAVACAFLAACSQETPPHLRPLTKEAMHLLGKKGMSTQSPIFIRIYKAESELEVWKQRDDGRFYHYKTYPVCNWSGDLGPKLKQGDKQSPEGFYSVSRTQMNPNSSFHLSFNLGFPNDFDRVHGRTGQFLMVHGDCRSAGCYAMTDALIEEIYALAREAFAGGQERFWVHAYPFRMTEENMTRHKRNKWYPFWVQMKRGHDEFEQTRVPPEVKVCARRYLVNARFINGATRVDPGSPCPPFEWVKQPAFSPVDAVTAKLADERIKVAGTKVRDLERENRMALGGPAPFGLTKSPGHLLGLNLSLDRLFKPQRPNSFDRDSVLGLE